MPLRTFVVNSSHYVPNSYNTYRFPLIGNPDLTGCKIGVQTASIFNCTFNIRAFWGNNSITVGFPTTAVTNSATVGSVRIKPLYNPPTANPYYSYYTNYIFTFPDSYMSISDMNFFLQSQCIANGLYATNALGQNIYFIELVINSTQYAAQLNIYPIPTTTTAATNNWTASTNLVFQTSTPPTLYLPVLPLVQFSQPFGNLLGLNAVNNVATNGYDVSTGFSGYGGPSSGTTTLNILSQLTPNINPVNSYVLTCSLLNSPYSIPNNIFYTIPLTGQIGSMITVQSSDAVMNDIAPNHYDYIEIRLCDQNMNPLMLQDTEMTLTLALQDNRVPLTLKGVGITS